MLIDYKKRIEDLLLLNNEECINRHKITELLINVNAKFGGLIIADWELLAKQKMIFVELEDNFVSELYIVHEFYYPMIIKLNSDPIDFYRANVSNSHISNLPKDIRITYIQNNGLKYTDIISNLNLELTATADIYIKAYRIIGVKEDNIT